MLGEYVTEVAMERISAVDKNRDGAEIRNLTATIASRTASRGITDYDLFLSAMKKVSTLQSDIAKKNKELEASERLVRRLEDEIRVLHIAQESTSKDSHEVTCLRRKVSELQKKVRDMEEFLADYGLIWLGPGCSDTPRTVPVTPSNPTTIEIRGRSLSDRTFDLLLLSIRNLNESIQADEAKVVYAQQASNPSTGSRIARLGRTEPVPLTFYADGIIMFAGPFRCYTQTSTLQFLQDILDGFFPSELQARYPDGVPILVSDRRTEWYQKLETIQPGEDPELQPLLPKMNKSSAFLGVGHRLGGDAPVSRLVRNSPHVATSRTDFQIISEHSPTRTNPSGIEDRHQDWGPSVSNSCTLNELLSHLPTPKSQGSRFSQEASPAINDEMLSSVLAETDWSVGNTAIRIRSPSGQHVYNLTVNASDTIGHLHETLEKLLPQPLHLTYRLVLVKEPEQQHRQEDANDDNSVSVGFTAQSHSSGLRRVVLSDRKQTLEGAGIRGSCVLFLELEDTRVERECGTSPIFEPLAEEDLKQNMDFAWTPDSIKSLQSLLSPTDDTSDEEQGSRTAPKFTPGDIGKKKKKASKREIKPVDPNAIWDADEVPEVEDVQDIYDPRPEPEYEILFKQDVTTEDIYLQMGNKTPTTASCEYMVIRIKLPSTSRDQIKLDVKEQFLDLRTPLYKLGLHLPNPVKPDSSRAKWDVERSVLELTLHNCRDFDFMNF
nr:unnamed protein product [Spirometra erinaceieuropaei]